MIYRCHRPQHISFPRYGGRGIAVCRRWRDSFEGFVADVGARPSPQHSLDRINNDGNYEPGNVRWATASEQQINSSRARFIEAFGQKLTISEWSRKMNIPKGSLIGRLDNGWPSEKALLLPAHKGKPHQLRAIEAQK